MAVYAAADNTAVMQDCWRFYSNGTDGRLPFNYWNYTGSAGATRSVM